MTDEDEDNFDAYKPMLPDDGIPVYGIQLIHFITPEGKEEYRWHIDGDPKVSDTLATMEMVKMDIYKGLVLDALDIEEEEDEE